MRASRFEIKVEDILTAAGLNFKEEYVFPDLVGNKGWPLRFDFAVFDDEGNLDFLIECQGVQHYISKPKFGGPAGLRKQKFYDNLKLEYCKKHNITLVILPYWDEARVNYDFIMKLAGY